MPVIGPVRIVPALLEGMIRQVLGTVDCGREGRLVMHVTVTHHPHHGLRSGNRIGEQDGEGEPPPDVPAERRRFEAHVQV